MTVDGSPEQALLRLQRKNYLVGAGALLSSLLLHFLVTWSVPLPLLTTMLVSTLGIGLIGLCVGAGKLSMRAGGGIAGALAFVTTTLCVQQSGGPNSPYFHVFIVLPFILATFSPDSRMPTLVAGLAGLAATVGVDVLAHLPPDRIFLHAMSCATLVGLALFGSRVYRRMMVAQQATHAERLQALDKLAESERLRGQAVRERAEVERLVLVGQRAAGGAHVVNNPLAFVKANLSHLRRELHDGGRPLDLEELEEVLDETQQGVQRIQQIVMDLRGFARAGALGEEQQGRLEDAVLEARRLISLRLREGGEVDLSLSPGLPLVRMGQRHMVQVMVNLLLNAVDAVEASLPSRRIHITVSARAVMGGVNLCVEDNGPGIPQEVLPRLFEPFFTTKPPGKGTGLGLALCREYVSRAGGSLHAENHSGGGARFVLTLPAAEQAPTAHA